MSDGDFKLYLDERFNNLTTNMNAHFRTVDERLEKIETQTTKTNGRVTELEKWRSEECGKMSESARLQIIQHNAKTRVLQTERELLELDRFFEDVGEVLETLSLDNSLSPDLEKRFY